MDSLKKSVIIEGGKQMPLTLATAKPADRPAPRYCLQCRFTIKTLEASYLTGESVPRTMKHIDREAQLLYYK